MEKNLITDYVIDCCQIHFSGQSAIHSPYFHLIAVMQGTLYCNYNNASYCNICYQLPGTAGTILKSDNCTCIHLILKPEFLLDHLCNTLFFQRNNVCLQPEANQMLKQSIYRFASLSGAYSRTGALYEILQILSDSISCDSSLSADDPMSEPKDLCNKITAYIQQHYSEDLSQLCTARQFHITPQYLARILKQHTGKTFKAYLLDLRMQKASDYLNYTQLSINDIRLRTRLPEQASIFQTIPKHRTYCPSDYNFGAKTPMTTASYAQKSSDHRYVNTDASCLNEVIFDLNKKKYPLPSFWNKLINLGYASDLKNLKFEEQLQQLQEHIGFTYGRICRITDLIGANIADHKKINDYTAAFSILDAVISNKMLPFLEIGNKTFLVQTDTATYFTPQSQTESIQYYEKVLILFPDFIRACINRYGQECFDKWRFEVSYMFIGLDEAKTLSFPHYLAYFQKIYHMIRSFSKQCLIGGPGFNYWSNIQTLQNCLKMFTRYQTVPDFFTAYLYSIDRKPSGIYAISKDPEVLKKRMQTFTREVLNLFSDKKIWITEFNSNLSSRNHLNDFCYQASFIAKTFIDNMDSEIEALGYYLLSDAALRYSDALEFMFGGWGLFTDSNIPKPSYFAYQIFSMLGKYLVKKTDSFLLCENSNGNFQLLVNHYAHPSENYHARNINREDVLNRYSSLFMHTKDSEFRFYFLHIPAGIYLIKEYRISAEKSNLFYEWIKMGFLTPSSQYDLDDLKRLSILTPKFSVISVKKNEPLILDCRQTGLETRLYLIEQYYM